MYFGIRPEGSCIISNGHAKDDQKACFLTEQSWGGTHEYTHMELLFGGLSWYYLEK